MSISLCCWLTSRSIWCCGRNSFLLSSHLPCSLYPSSLPFANRRYNILLYMVLFNFVPFHFITFNFNIPYLFLYTIPMIINYWCFQNLMFNFIISRCKLWDFLQARAEIMTYSVRITLSGGCNEIWCYDYTPGRTRDERALLHLQPSTFSQHAVVCFLCSYWCFTC